MSETTITRAASRAHGWRLRVAALALLACVPATQAACKYRRTGSIPLTWGQGVPHIAGAINGQAVDMIVATGTSGILVPSGLADELKLPQRHTDTFWMGPQGRVQGYDARVEDIRFGSAGWQHVTLPVSYEPDGRVLQVGNTFLMQADLELSAQAITFFEPSDCDDVALAYWADGVPWTAIEATSPGDRRAVVTVQIDGQPVRALISSGSARSVLDLGAAHRLGFDEHAAGVQQVHGVYGRSANAWLGTFDTFAIDEETVRHAHLVVTDLWGRLRQDMNTAGGKKVIDEEPELVLGADFLQAHRVLFARSQHRFYFSYVGGALFSESTESAVAPAPPGSR